jgi:pimeloyl-ACP methyl ester carboxylesterase
MSDRPVLLVHGLASSFEHNWRATGWVDILADDGRQALAMDLPGHGGSGAQDPATLSPAGAVLAALGDYPRVDAVGFSAGGHALLGAAAAAPQRFGRIAVLGVGNLRDPAKEAGDAGSGRDDHAGSLAAALEAPATPADQTARLMRQLVKSAGNDPRAVAAFLRARHPGLATQDLAAIRLPVLVVLGDRDFAGPADDLIASLPDARLVTLPGTDHFATPSDYRCIEAVSRFLAG